MTQSESIPSDPKALQEATNAYAGLIDFTPIMQTTFAIMQSCVWHPANKPLHSKFYNDCTVF